MFIGTLAINKKIDLKKNHRITRLFATKICIQTVLSRKKKKKKKKNESESYANLLPVYLLKVFAVLIFARRLLGLFSGKPRKLLTFE
ncbi:hypothetical protein OH492_05945 [Vibrio chagasii]|nr:hypothetical protein [Vibrio chagasii]